METKFERCSWDELHMSQAELMARRSTCARLAVGAVLVRNNRTISQGYNGVGSGCEHCIDYWKKFHQQKDIITDNITTESTSFEDFRKSNFFIEKHKMWSTANELHAEQNCILWAAKEGISTNNTTLYTIYSPCINCAKVIFTAGVTRVIYKYEYNNDMLGIAYLKNNNIICEKI